MNSRPSRNQLTYVSDKRHNNNNTNNINCCILRSASPVLANVVDLAWFKFCKQKSSVIDHALISYLLEKLPKAVIHAALDDDLRENLPKELDQDLLFCQWLLPWILFNKILRNDFELDHFNSHTTSAENILIHHQTISSKEEQCFIEAILTTDYSLYKMVAIVEDQALLVKNLLLISEDRLKEQKAALFLKQGNIFFRRILALDNQFQFIGVARFRSLEHHLDLLAFRKSLNTKNDDQPLVANVLRNCLERYLHQCFLNELMQSLKQPRPSWVITHSDLMGNARKTKLYRNLLVTSSCILKQYPAWSVCEFFK